MKGLIERSAGARATHTLELTGFVLFHLKAPEFYPAAMPTLRRVPLFGAGIDGQLEVE